MPSDASPIEVLEDVIEQSTKLLEDITGDQVNSPTPCAEFNVGELAHHLTYWVSAFASFAESRQISEQAAEATRSDVPTAKYMAAGTSLIAALRSAGLDGNVKFFGHDLPTESLLYMALIEVVGHSLDLAKATGQHQPFSAAQLALTLERAKAKLPATERGDAGNFASEVQISNNADLADRVLAFLGRQPSVVSSNAASGATAEQEALRKLSTQQHQWLL